MDVNIINPILDAFTEILPQIGFCTVEKKSVSLVESTVEYDGVLVNIALLGSIKGVVLIGMDMESAMVFASKMMMGMEVLTLDPLAQSALSEMGNMVVANSCMHFNKIGIEGLDISPPTVLISELGTATLPVPKAIMLCFTVDEINVNVYVGIV